jgi:hypothetical protein
MTRASRLLLVPMMIASASAFAQSTDNQMAQALMAPYPTGYNAQFAQEFGACAARDVATYSRTVMKALPATPASDKALFWTVLSSNSCSDKRNYDFNPRALRGPVAEYFLKRDFDLSTWTSKRKPLPTFATPVVADFDRLQPDTRAGVTMIVIGTCVFQADRTNSAALFRTTVDTPADSAAFAALGPALSKCIASGSQLKMSKFQLRGALAEAAYRTSAASANGRN